MHAGWNERFPYFVGAKDGEIEGHSGWSSPATVSLSVLTIPSVFFSLIISVSSSESVICRLPSSSHTLHSAGPKYPHQRTSNYSAAVAVVTLGKALNK